MSGSPRPGRQETNAIFELRAGRLDDPADDRRALAGGEERGARALDVARGDDDQQAEAEKDAVEQVRAAGKESEAIGTLGQSRPSVKTMFEEVYAIEDWRLIEQRREVGV